jgi:peptide-methionine (S)-S-oxide reductase
MSSRPSARRLLGPVALACAAGIALGAAALGGGASGAGWGPDRPMKVPAAAVQEPASAANEETAVLAGGCFWGLQGVFEHVRGVKRVVAGYAGGTHATADYETVSTGLTGHAESVKIVFDPRQVSFGQILQVYFSVATDPTQLNRQFPDEGPQYRGDIFYTTPQQKMVAERYIAQLNAAKVFHAPIATRIDGFSGFYDAERYHQDYLIHHPDQPYIATYDMPKIAALKALFPTLYSPEPVRV